MAKFLLKKKWTAEVLLEQERRAFAESMKRQKLEFEKERAEDKQTINHLYEQVFEFSQKESLRQKKRLNREIKRRKQAEAERFSAEEESVCAFLASQMQSNSYCS